MKMIWKVTWTNAITTPFDSSLVSAKSIQEALKKAEGLHSGDDDLSVISVVLQGQLDA